MRDCSERQSRRRTRVGSLPAILAATAPAASQATGSVAPSRGPGERLRRKPRLVAAGIVIVAGLLSSDASGLDRVRSQIGVDAAVAQFGVTGSGVIVAVMDRGVDWKNADFRNVDGSTRIAYIFDLTDDTGAHAVGNPYGKGTIYTRQQIDTALTQGTPLATRDAVGHGTTTTAIAAGNGRNSPSLKYRGIAPEATIVSVKVVSDGAPAHDGEPAEAPFYDPARLPIAIDFIRDKATQLGLPCVMILNLGSQAGPTDGSSALARKIDATVGPGIPGLVFVTGTGDDGGMPNRAAGTVPLSATHMLQVNKGNGTTPLYLDLWYPGADKFDVTIQTPSGTFGPYTSPSTNSAFDIRQTADFLYYHLGSSVDFYDATNGKREIWIRLDGPIGTYKLSLYGSAITTGRFDATVNPSQFWSAYNNNFFLNDVAPGSLWDGATAFSNVCPNSYMIRTSWTDIDGIPRQIIGEGNVGEIWRGSSTGPTFDGRFGVDVSAPGDRIVTTYNPKSYWATFRFNLINDGAGLYGIASAVSAASPIVTGVVALMLQRNPSLDAPTVKQILRGTAHTDSFTGATPNTTWGYGKIDAYAAISQSVGPPAASHLFLLAPCRVADTRNPTGPSGGPALAANAVRSFPVTGICGIPSSATAVAINLAVFQPSNDGDLRVYPAGRSAPLASSINFRSGIVRANNAIVPLGTGGQISIQCDMPSGATHFFFDVFGYFQ